MKDIKKVKAFLFDMDGTIYLGNQLLPGMPELFFKLNRMGKMYYYVTNNSSKTHLEYVNLLTAKGFPAKEENILISTDAMMKWIKEYAPLSKILFLGVPSVEQGLKDAGVCLVDNNEKPDYVVVGFDKTITYEKVSVACKWIQEGIPYVTTHMDLRCPTDDGFIPDAGSIVGMIENTTNVKPQLVFGKPYGYMVDYVLQHTGLKKDEIAMVGDRLYTDIAFGVNNGIMSIAVLSGETTLEEIEHSSIKPDMILNNASEILKYV